MHYLRCGDEDQDREKKKEKEKEVEAPTQESDVEPKKPSDLIFNHFVVECSRRFNAVLKGA